MSMIASLTSTYVRASRAQGEQKGELKGEEGNWFDGVLSPLALCSADRKQSKRTDEGWLQDG